MIAFGSETELSWAALVGDVEGSREVRERAALQERLMELVRGLSARLVTERVLGAPLELTRGDEVQGLFAKPEGAVEVIRTLADALHPVRMLFGLGYGPLSTALAERPSLMDGPCFHRAREGLEAARRDRGWLVVRGFGDPCDEAVTAMFRLMDAVRSRWTARQAAYVKAAREARHQKDVAEAFGVRPSVVSESLKAAAYEAVVQGERAAGSLLAFASRVPTS